MKENQKYRGRAVAGEWAIEVVGAEQTPRVVGLLEVTLGPDLGQRIRYTGFLSPKAAERTIGELRTMGWKADRLGDWSGMGAREVEFSCLADVNPNTGKRYLRAAFVYPVRRLEVQNGATRDAVDALNRGLRGLLAGGAPAPQGPDPMPLGDGEIGPDDELGPEDPALAFP